MDRRTKYTQQIIKETFFDLLDEKNINKITVSEICSIADINRATFYRYYVDIFDLFNKIEEELYEEFIKVFNTKTEKNQSLFEYASSILEICLKNRKLVKIIFNNKNNNYVLNDILEKAYQVCIENWSKQVSNLNEDDAIFAAVFIFNGALGIINYWVKTDFEKDVKVVAKYIEDLANSGTDKFIYKKDLN